MGKDNELMLDVGQANEIKLAARRAGATNADLKKLSEGDMFARILPVLRGMAVVVPAIIDCDADPFVPEEEAWKVEEHIKGGKFKWDPAKVALYLSEEQKKKDGFTSGNNLRKELRTKTVLNANALDYLFAHPHLIPEAWKGKFVFFWGTKYRAADNKLYVRCLIWRNGRWEQTYDWFDCVWFDYYTVAVLKD